MIPLLDISNFATPYDLYASDWNLISGGWEKMRAEGLAGGILSGGVLGETKTVEPVDIIAQCDFSRGQIVEQIQAELGVPVTGYFDEATCTGWFERYGEEPTARVLEQSIGATCGSVVVPRCPNLEGRSPPSIATMMLVGAGVATLGLYLLSRRRR